MAEEEGKKCKRLSVGKDKERLVQEQSFTESDSDSRQLVQSDTGTTTISSSATSQPLVTLQRSNTRSDSYQNLSGRTHLSSLTASEASILYKPSGFSNDTSVASHESISGQANNEGGFNFYHARHRSILVHHLGLPLFLYLHGQDLSKAGELKPKSHTFQLDSDSDLFDNVLKDALSNTIKKCQDKMTGNDSVDTVEQDKEDKKSNDTINICEPVLTKSISTTLNSELDASHEVPVCTTNNRFGKTDIFISKQQNSVISSVSESRKTRKGKGLRKCQTLPSSVSNVNVGQPLAILEFGMGCKIWWKKLHQCFLYCQTLADLNQPLMCASITIDMNKAIKKDGSDDNFDGRIRHAMMGVFLCVPMSENDIKVSLLWHHKSNGVESTSKALGLLLRAVYNFNIWNGAGNSMPENFAYYSSNCCRVSKDYTFRVYDSRIRQTQRSDIVYRCDRLKSITGYESDIVDIAYGSTDDSTDVQFWNSHPNSTTTCYEHEQYLRIIKVAYREGNHHLEHPKQLSQIVDSLEKLHTEGFVHGDIRQFNLVFATDHCYLLDYDFGGKISENVKYPKGYNAQLCDGYRPGKAEGIISKLDDWRSLLSIIHRINLTKGIPNQFSPQATFCHHWNINFETSDGDICKVYPDFKEVSEPIKSEQLMELFVEDFKSHLKYLDKENATFEPTENFRSEMSKFKNEMKINITKEGTGSSTKTNVL